MMPDFPNLLLWAVPVFALSVALEWWGVKSGRIEGDYDTRDAFASMTMGSGKLIGDILIGFISLGFLMWLWQYRLFEWAFSLPVLVAVIVLQDLVYYWKHRTDHVVRWFWSAHVVHHSSEHYNLTTALRQPWNNHFTGNVIWYSPLVLAGFHPLLIGFSGAINLLYQYWLHTEAIGKMPRWFEAVMNTPSHHRVHHGTNARYLDSNFAGIFIIWDRLFGTFVPENDSETISYGIIKPVGSYNPVKIAFIELANIFRDAAQPGLKLSQRLKYMFAPPGYSHDHSRKTSAQIKGDYVRLNPSSAGEAGLPKTVKS